MESSDQPARVLVVAHPTAATPGATRRGPSTVPRSGQHASRCCARRPCTASRASPTPRTPRDDEARDLLALALPLLEDAAGSEVERLIGVQQPLDAIQDAVNIHGFDEIIISTLPRASRSGCTSTCRPS